MPSSEPMEGRCGAQLRKRPGQYCTSYPADGRSRCRLHGGASPRGVDSPHYRGRGYSKDIPTRLADRFEKALADPELTSLASEIALNDARLGELLSQLPTAEAGVAWDVMRTSIASMRTALTELRMDDAVFHLNQMEEALSHHEAERDTWHDIHNVITQRVKLVDTERKRDEMLAGNMTSRQAMAFMGALQAAVLDEVKDPATLARLAMRFSHLLNSESADGHIKAGPLKFTQGRELQEAEILDEDQGHLLPGFSEEHA